MDRRTPIFINIFEFIRLLKVRVGGRRRPDRDQVSTTQKDSGRELVFRDCFMAKPWGVSRIQAKFPTSALFPLVSGTASVYLPSLPEFRSYCKFA
jgi:hypothetical protein